mgnify:CR=1 FL=1
MEVVFDIISRLVTGNLPASLAILAGAFLIFLVFISSFRHQKPKGPVEDIDEIGISEANFIITEKEQNTLNYSAHSKPNQSDGPSTSPGSNDQIFLEIEDSKTLEITRDLDLKDSPVKLAPEHAFSVEIRENEAELDLSHIAPKFAAEPSGEQSETTGVARESSDIIDYDKISIPRLASEDTTDIFSGLLKKGTLDEDSNANGTHVDADNKLRTSTEIPINNQVKNELSDNFNEKNCVNAGVVTPDVIANAVAELIDNGKDELAIANSVEGEQNPSKVGSAALPPTSEKLSDGEENVFDQIEHLAEVEGKMRALRELFEAGLIAPEVYLLKAREYASNSL